MKKENDNVGPIESILSDTSRLCGNLLVSLDNHTLSTPALGKADFDQIKVTLEVFRQKFSEREHVDWTDSVNRCYQALEDPLARLDEFFQNILGQGFDIEERRQAFYVAFFLEKEIAQLRDVARQIDESNVTKC